MTIDSSSLASLSNSRSIALDKVPLLALGDFQKTILGSVKAGRRVSALFGAPAADEGNTPLYAVLADDEENKLYVLRTIVSGERFPSLTPDCPQVHLFEREIAEQFGLVPEGHPWLKPVRYRHSWTNLDAWNRPPGEPILPAVGDFYKVDGDEVHEVAVGPVHAGVIEPGHFRFQCNGEKVFHLEIALGYQHRGVEEAMIGGPTSRSIHFAETLAGDTTIAHCTAYCQILEALAHCQKPPRAQVLRAISLELERLANHVGDLGALANDVGYLPTASYCGRIRGDFLNMTALLCGSRFGRGMVRPGGVAFDADEKLVEELLKRLGDAERDTFGAVNLLWETPSVMARFEGIGILPHEVAIELGIVGPAARASGVARDVRQDQPSGLFRFAHIPMSTCDAGDVLSRAFIRRLEIQHSIEFIREQLHQIPSGPVKAPVTPLAPKSLAVALSEGWRGEVCHVALTDERGRFSRYKVVDPSFHNWTALAYVLRGQEISDFPLCNKSFNLSYCGHDL
ncbi:MAG: NADH-quinone oxidoreductase subunit C [Planctomycetes bacterium]|nr:NADH-quinone oxidoreductase subunit C [Planctomycetota bacterium]